MKVVLLREARIRHQAGETVEVSPAEFQFLVSTGSARPLGTEAEAEEPKKKTARKAKAEA